MGLAVDSAPPQPARRADLRTVAGKMRDINVALKDRKDVIEMARAMARARVLHIQ